MRLGRRMLNRLSHKFILGIIAILLLMMAGSILLNTRIAERYYLYRQRQYVGAVGSTLASTIEEGIKPEDAVAQIEESENVLIVYTERIQDPETLGTALRDAFREKGLGFQRFWLWEEDYARTLQDGSRFRLYQQDKLNYSILVQYLTAGEQLYAIAAIVPNAAVFIQIINRFGIVLYSLSVFAAIILIYILIRRITKPLDEIEQFTKRLSAHQFQPLQIKTGDELEHVADSLNQMGREIEQYQKDLQLKNEQMKRLLNDVAHDLKTPISIISTYSSGIEDGLDDGSFLETIRQQNQKMSQIVERLLDIARIEQGDYPLENVRLDRLLSECLEEHRMLFRQRGLEVQAQIEKDAVIYGNPELLRRLFSNLLSNAGKYASEGAVGVCLHKDRSQGWDKEAAWVFELSNEFENQDLDTERIWEPFYVGEVSRNKALSGTGLGLSVVRQIAARFGYTAECGIEGYHIVFRIRFEESKDVKDN